ncbi:FYVE, RhoGEF and PH domain-containing protein 1 isoform X1 [Tachysurus ichikawai]
MQLNRPRSALIGFSPPPPSPPSDPHPSSFSSQFKTMRFSYHLSPQPGSRRTENKTSSAECIGAPHKLISSLMEIMKISPRDEKTTTQLVQLHSHSSLLSVLMGSCYGSAGTRSAPGRTGSESGGSSRLCEENNTCVNESDPLEISGALLCPEFELRVHI